MNEILTKQSIKKIKAIMKVYPYRPYYVKQVDEKLHIWKNGELIPV